MGLCKRTAALSGMEQAITERQECHASERQSSAQQYISDVVFGNVTAKDNLFYDRIMAATYFLREKQEAGKRPRTPSLERH